MDLAFIIVDLVQRIIDEGVTHEFTTTAPWPPSMGTLNTQWAVIFPLLGLFMPFSVFWMRAHFINVPKELSEASRVDGASIWQEFRQIQLPLAVPALSALAILLFLWTWNQFLLPVVLIANPLDRTVAGALTFFQGQYSLSIPLLNAGALLIITPAIIVFLIFQRQLSAPCSRAQ